MIHVVARVIRSLVDPMTVNILGSSYQVSKAIRSRDSSMIEKWRVRDHTTVLFAYVRTAQPDTSRPRSCKRAVSVCEPDCLVIMRLRNCLVAMSRACMRLASPSAAYKNASGPDRIRCNAVNSLLTCMWIADISLTERKAML